MSAGHYICADLRPVDKREVSSGRPHASEYAAGFMPADVPAEL